MSTHPVKQASIDGGENVHGRPGVALVYLFFVFLPLFYLSRVSLQVILASAVAVAVFVPMYLGFFNTSGRVRLLLMLATAAIGYALIPFNPGGNTFLIYAMAMAADVLTPRTAITVSLALVVPMALEFWWLMPQPAYAVAGTVVVVVIGGMVMAGIFYARARERRNAELRLTQDEVRRLARLAERERIGRDLHDLLGHTLSLVALKSELAGKLVDRDPAVARAQIREVEVVARQALAQVREAVTGIRVAGIEAELAAARLALLSAGIALDQRVAPVSLAADVEAVLALALREATTNILRHSAACRVEVELSTAGDHVQFTVSDDGRGGASEHGHGLAGMRERVDRAGGRLEIDSPHGAGTRLRIVLPNRRPVEGAVQAVS